MLDNRRESGSLGGDSYLSLRRAHFQELLLISVLGDHCGAAFLRRGPDYQIGRYSRRGDWSGRKPDLAAGFGPARLALFLGQLEGPMSVSLEGSRSWLQGLPGISLNINMLEST